MFRECYFLSTSIEDVFWPYIPIFPQRLVSIPLDPSAASLKDPVKISIPRYVLCGQGKDEHFEFEVKVCLHFIQSQSLHDLGGLLNLSVWWLPVKKKMLFQWSSLMFEFWFGPVFRSRFWMKRGRCSEDTVVFGRCTNLWSWNIPRYDLHVYTETTLMQLVEHDSSNMKVMGSVPRECTN